MSNKTNHKYCRFCLNCFKLVEIKPNKKYYCFDTFHFVCSKECYKELWIKTYGANNGK